MSPLIARRMDVGSPSSNGHLVTAPTGLSVAPPSTAGVLRPRRNGVRYQQRSFTAAATPINTTNRQEAQRLKKLRQPWQDEAWEYRDAIGELRYATTYLGNSARRMILIPSAYMPGELNPIPLENIDECPASVLAACNDALERLAVGGSVALGGMLRDITENFEVAGECYLCGSEQDGQEVWDIRSISEVHVDSDGQLILKENGSGGNNNQGEPINGFVSRLWWPHPRRKAYADSPFKSILDIAEELLILSRDIRAAGRSRLANNGILLLPDSLTVIRASMEDDANDSLDGDEFFQELVATAMAALQDEGSSAATLPIIARGPAEALQYVRQLVISRQDPSNKDKRQELITRMATGIDLPAEVLTGKADLNHWTSWQVSDDTFRHHIEPIVMVETDALTLGYYRPELKARGDIPEDWLNRIVLWYDPTNLVTHPDRSQDAMNAHDRMALSDESLRDHMGFEESDAPEVEEILLRLATKSRMDPVIAAQILKALDPSLDITGVGAAPQVQMIGPGPGQPAQPEEAPPEEGTGPAALPAAAIGHALLELLQGGTSEEFGGPGSGRYPKGSGGGKPPTEHTPVAKGEGESIGIGGREDLTRGMATEAELSHARDVAVEKFKSCPTPTDADREAARLKHERSTRQGGDDRPNSKQRKASRSALAREFGDGNQCPCVACGRNVGTDSTMSLDRIIPGSDGGSYGRKNLVPNCYDCNRVRSNTSFDQQDWVKERMSA